MGAFENKILAVVGNWEPMFYRVRQGGYHVNEQEFYDYEHSQEMVEQLAQEGINLVLLHFYKGMGFEQEQKDMEESRRFIERCHNLGIMVGTYIQWGTFWAETFLKEHPDALDYCQKDRFGRPSMYSETYWSYHRYRICASSGKYQDFLKEVVRYSVEHAGTDLVYFDNFGQNPCYCDYCKQGFQNYLSKKYPDKASMISRIGLEEIDSVQLPFGADRNPIDSMEVVRNPMVQEWINFRCEQLSEALMGIKSFLGTLTRKVPLAINPPILYGDNAPLVWGMDIRRVAGATDLFFSEDPNFTQITKDGRLISQHRFFKTGRMLKNGCLRFHTNSDNEEDVAAELIALSEAAVLNDGNVALVKNYGSIAKTLHPRKKEYIEYFRDNTANYAGVEQISEVAVYKNFESLTWAWPKVYPKITIIEQLLIQSGAQFSYLMNNELDGLDKYKAIVVSEIWCMSETQIAKMAAFVERGGGLLVTGQSGSRDLWFRAHFVNVLGKALDKISETKSPALYTAFDKGAGGGFRDSKGTPDGMWNYGKGRVCWISQVIGRHPVNQKFPGQIWMIDNSCWDVPDNWEEIIKGLDWVLGDGRWIPMKIPSTVVPQVSRPSAADRLLIHLINYEKNKRIEDFTIQISESLAKPKRVLWQSPENKTEKELRFNVASAGIEVELPAWDNHGTVILA